MSKVPRRGIEPRPTDSKSVMLSITLAGRIVQQPIQESNLVQQLRKLTCYPAHSRAILFKASQPGIEPGPRP